MAGIQAPALAAGGAHLPRSARASIFHATLFSVKRILAGRGVVWGTIPPPNYINYSHSLAVSLATYGHMPCRERYTALAV